MTDPTYDSRHDPTPCPEREEALALHAGGDLPPADAHDLERHLAGCEGCRTFLAEMEESLQAFSGWTVAPPAEDLSQLHHRVMETVRSERTEGVSPWRRSSVRWAAAAALLLILGAALLWRLGMDRDSDRPDPRDPVIAARTDESPEAPRVDPSPRPPIEPPSSPSTPQAARVPDVPESRPAPIPKSVPQPMPEPETQRASVEDAPDLKIQLVSDDPDIVIYWLVEPEKPQDATSTT